MPRDVTVEWPHAWILRGIKLHYGVASCADQEDISALGIGWPDDCLAVPFARAFVKDVHVEAVKVHGVAVRE